MANPIFKILLFLAVSLIKRAYKSLNVFLKDGIPVFCYRYLRCQQLIAMFSIGMRYACMKTSILTSLMICIHVCGQSQSIATDTLEDTYTSLRTKPYEIAYVAAGLNLKDEMSFGNTGWPTVEFLNGVLIRYKFNQLSLRLNASFFESESAEHARFCINCVAGSSTAKNYRIGAGLQWTPLVKKELLYAFLDCNYKQRQEDTRILDSRAGSSTGYAVHAKVRGLDLVAGLGAKLRIYKNFYCSGEIAYNQYIAKNKQRAIQSITQDTSSETNPYHFDTFLARLYLSLVF